MPDKAENIYTDILKIILLILLFALASYALSFQVVRREIFGFFEIHPYFTNHQWARLLVMICGLVAFNALGLPRTWVSVISGSVYGASAGIILGQLITLAGATLNFYTGRWILRDTIGRRVSDRFMAWYDRFSSDGFYWVLNIRLFPVGNATMVSLISGASRMTYRDFIAATFLGYLPLTIVFGLFGSSAAQQKPLQLIIGAVLFLAFFFGRKIYKKRDQHAATEYEKPGA